MISTTDFEHIRQEFAVWGWLKKFNDLPERERDDAYAELLDELEELYRFYREEAQRD